MGPRRHPCEPDNGRGVVPQAPGAQATGLDGAARSLRRGPGVGRGAAVHAARAPLDARSPPPRLRHEPAAARGVGGHLRRRRRAHPQAARARRVSPTRGLDPRPTARPARLGGEAAASGPAARRRLAPAARRRRLDRGPSAPRCLPPPDGRSGGAQQVRGGPPRGARRAARPCSAADFDRCGCSGRRGRLLPPLRLSGEARAYPLPGAGSRSFPASDQPGRRRRPGHRPRRGELRGAAYRRVPRVHHRERGQLSRLPPA